MPNKLILSLWSLKHTSQQQLFNKKQTKIGVLHSGLACYTIQLSDD